MYLIVINIVILFFILLNYLVDELKIGLYLNEKMGLDCFEVMKGFVFDFGLSLDLSLKIDLFAFLLRGYDFILKVLLLDVIIVLYIIHYLIY
jgi:hypothetical protein